MRTVDFRVVYSHAPPPDDGAAKYNSDYITYKSDGYKSGGHGYQSGGGGGGYRSESGLSDYDPSATVGGVEAQISPPYVIVNNNTNVCIVLHFASQFESTRSCAK